MHSHDYRIRVTCDDLASLRLRHLCTTEDLGSWGEMLPSPTRAGSTEWHGEFAGRPVSVGWEWIQKDGGGLQALMDVPPRTNLMIIDAKGYDLPESEFVDALWCFLRQLAWQAEAVQDVAPELSVQGAHLQ